MRIGWATPFNTRSAIGKFSRAVCNELNARGYDIEIIRVEGGAERELEGLSCDLSVIDAADCEVDDYDELIVNFGNHAHYHAQTLALVAKRSPLGIFHDMEMRDFEWGLMHRHAISMPHLLGVEQELADESPSDLVNSEARPVLATLAAMTCGAVIHGPHYRETIAAFCPGLVDIIPLCFPDTGTARAAVIPSPGRRVTIFGMINDNKQPGRVLEALALLRPRLGPVELHLAGEIEDRVRSALLAQSKRLGLKSPFFHGYVSDDRLQDVIENSHAVCCLRYPVTEGGSASLVTALFRARPLIISDVASYSMVPDRLAFKVSYGEDPHDLAEVLLEIFKNPDAAEARAIKAREWAKERFSAPAYVDALEPLLRSIGQHASLAKTARQLVPSFTTPSHEPMLVGVNAFAEVLDWMEASQKD
ncbi:MAG: glycosyltransferase family 4 protein [Sphingomonas bacterium]|nr:glycosyltransferase family 4 protein [Sphingomonas bacterium]